eukprot:Anaeramoba_flamelloidesa810278_27.p1 GENE.a810278_27~~a810278_27.p1  ORF type:complete len:223 (+),score=38.71 a810278_27:35-670(+)
MYPYLVNFKRNHDSKPLMSLLNYSCFKTLSSVKVLVEHGANLIRCKESVLHLLFQNHLAGRNSFRAANTKFMLPQSNKYPYFDLEIIEYLYEQLKSRVKFDINDLNAEGNSLLHTVCECEQKVPPKVLRFFLENGAKVSLENKNGNTPLYNILSQESEINKDLIPILVEFGAKLDHINKQGRCIFEQLLLFNLKKDLPFGYWQLALKNPHF